MDGKAPQGFLAVKEKTDGVIISLGRSVHRGNIINLHNITNKIISPILCSFFVYMPCCDQTRHCLFGIRLGFRLIYPGSDYDSDCFANVSIRIPIDEMLVRLAYGMD